MTYGAFLLLFLVLPILALAVALRRRMTRAWRWSVGAVALIAVLYTTPWDNFIVAQGVWSYPSERVLGVTLGFVPLEEYVFFVLQVLLTGLVLLALTGRPVVPLPPAAGSDGTGYPPPTPVPSSRRPTEVRSPKSQT
jgi:lycopene cyclase domain-containing protein